MALLRLDASRTRLIQRLYPDPPKAAPPRPDGEAAAAPRLFASLLTRIERNGLVDGAWRMARAVARRWWTRQPWHGSVELIGSTLAHEARPIVRRHPWASLAAAAALGGALAMARPWITRSVRQRAEPWHTQFGQMLWKQLSQTPVQLALAGAITAWLTDLAQRPPHASPVRPAGSPATDAAHSANAPTAASPPPAA